jgi:hypothetical protein
MSQKRPRLSWAGVLTYSVAVGVSLSLPPVTFDGTVRAQGAVGEEVAAGAAKPQAAEPFTATFSNGAKVQVIGLSESPSQGKLWWAPDGTRLDMAPYARLPFDARASKDQILREICFRWSNLPEDPDFEKRLSGILPSGTESGGGIPLDAQGEQVQDLTAWYTKLKPQDTCTLRFSVSVRATPWTTVFISEGNGVSAMSRTVEGVQQGVVIGKPYAEKGGTSITVSHQIPGEDVRLMAVGIDGLPDVGTSTGGAGAVGFSQTTYHYAGLAPGQIHQFLLQTQRREFETVEFRNVSLHPDKPTTVEIIGDAQLRSERAFAALQVLASEHGYRLAKNEPLKHMPLPFPAERADVAGLLGSYFGQGTKVASPPIEVIRYQWKDDQLVAQSFDHVKPTLQMVLDTVFGLKLQDLEGDLDLLTTQVPGDWVLSWDSREDHQTNVAEIAVLEHALRKHLDQAVKLELQDVERPVYVVRGRYKFTPVAGPDGRIDRVEGDVADTADGMFQIPGRRTNISLSVGSYRKFLSAMGQLILTPVIDEADQPPTKESLFWQYHGAIPRGVLEPFDDKTEGTILASISAQTGLTFHKEKRRVTALRMEREAR